MFPPCPGPKTRRSVRLISCSGTARRPSLTYCYCAGAGGPGVVQPNVSPSLVSAVVVSTSAVAEPVSASISDSVRPEALRRRAVW